MRCDLCGRDFDPPVGTIPVATLGRYFCCDIHEKKYIELYNKWLEVAYSERKYEQNNYVPSKRLP